MRADAQEWGLAGDCLIEGFVPAIVSAPDHQSASDRHPEWFAARYNLNRTGIIRRILNYIQVEWRVFTFLKKVPRARDIETYWLPGYLFLNFDVHRDRWAQINRIPGVFEILGSPTPIAPIDFDDLVTRLPHHLGKAPPGSPIALGKTVRVKRGPFEGHQHVVVESTPTTASVVMMMFNAPRSFTFQVSDLEVLD